MAPMPSCVSRDGAVGDERPVVSKTNTLELIFLSECSQLVVNALMKTYKFLVLYLISYKTFD